MDPVKNILDCGHYLLDDKDKNVPDFVSKL